MNTNPIIPVEQILAPGVVLYPQDGARPAYKKAHGVDAPPNDPKRSLQFFDGVATPVNFPPEREYPPYVVATTTDASYLPPLTGRPHVPDLCMEADARAMAIELFGPDAVDVIQGERGKINYGSETRREWGFVADGIFITLAPYIAAKNAAGIGAPGHWDSGEGPHKTWVSDVVPPIYNTTIALPPLRQLLSNEEEVLDIGPMGNGGLLGYRLKMVVPTGDGFTQADRDALYAIKVKVNA